MLSIGKLGAGQHSYYLGKVAEGAEDYYSGEGEAEGYWLGDAAQDLGLDGKVEPDQLVAMLTGRNPVDGEMLGLKTAPNREPVPGFDLTFSAPKSVSLTWALGGHPVSGQVKEAHAAAVAEALGYLERQACWARRGRGGNEFVPGNGFLATAYLHRSFRAGDPQLHTHVLIANATKGPDGRWSLHLRGSPAPRADPVPRRRVAAGRQRHRRHQRLQQRGAAALLHPSRRDPRGGGRGRLGASDAGRDLGDAQGQGPRPHLPRAEGQLMDVAARFGDNLVRVRRSADMSQDELSVRASVHRTEVSQLERGLRIARINTLAKLCASLEVEPGELMVGINWSPGDVRRGQFRERANG